MKPDLILCKFDICCLDITKPTTFGINKNDHILRMDIIIGHIKKEH